jgi:hypothetical protein
MNTADFFCTLVGYAHSQVDDAMQGTSTEQFNWAPPGTASPISAIFVHLLSSEDFFLQNILQDSPKLWDQQGWAGKIGVKNIPGFGNDWSEFRRVAVSLETALAYQQLVRASTQAYLHQLTARELERKVQFAGGEHSAADIMFHFCSHTLFHAGEIAILKGIQGARGLTY